MRQSLGFFVLSVLFLVGCESTPRLKAYDGELKPEQLAELAIPSDIRLVSVNGKSYSGVTDDDASEKQRALASSAAVDEGAAYPRRFVLVPAGDLQLVVGLSKQMVPFKRETHMAMVLLTGDVTYSKRMYPGSSQDGVLKFKAAPGGKYSVVVKWKRDDDVETWSFGVVDRAQDRKVPFDASKVIPHAASSSTALSPRDWAEQQRGAQQK